MQTVADHLKSSPLSLALVASGAAVVGAVALKRALFGRPKAGPRVTNYKKDTVYFFTFPSTRITVTVSPFALKVETWLRLHRIRYVAARKGGTWSRKGQIPFVELNGEELNESNTILAKLTDHFGVSDGLTDEQQGFARGLEMMLENQTFYSYMYFRVVEAVVKFMDMWEYLDWARRTFLRLTFPRYWKRRVRYHGIGRNTVSEIYAMGCQDILALSRVLGNKKYLFGNQMTTVDCYAFGHLAQILYLPLDGYPHKQFMRDQTPNLCEYVDRIKESLWPDWDQICMDNLHGSKD